MTRRKWHNSLPYFREVTFGNSNISRNVWASKWRNKINWNVGLSNYHFTPTYTRGCQNNNWDNNFDQNHHVHVHEYFNHHITLTSWWSRWHLKSPALQLCTQPFIKAHIKEKNQKLRVIGLCEENTSATGEFPAQRASNTENVSFWWRHHEKYNQRARTPNDVQCGGWWYHSKAMYKQTYYWYSDNLSPTRYQSPRWKYQGLGQIAQNGIPIQMVILGPNYIEDSNWTIKMQNGKHTLPSILIRRSNIHWYHRS